MKLLECGTKHLDNEHPSKEKKMTTRTYQVFFCNGEKTEVEANNPLVARIIGERKARHNHYKWCGKPVLGSIMDDAQDFIERTTACRVILS